MISDELFNEMDIYPITSFYHWLLNLYSSCKKLLNIYWLPSLYAHAISYLWSKKRKQCRFRSHRNLYAINHAGPRATILLKADADDAVRACPRPQANLPASLTSGTFRASLTPRRTPMTTREIILLSTGADVGDLKKPRPGRLKI
jgi:hypothetical protein